jgi:hypothetical protein
MRFFGRNVRSGMTGMTTARGWQSSVQALAAPKSSTCSYASNKAPTGLVAEKGSLSLQENLSSTGPSPCVHSRIRPILPGNCTDAYVKCLSLSTFRPSAETRPHGPILCTKVALHDFMQEKKC